MLAAPALRSAGGRTDERVALVALIALLAITTGWWMLALVPIRDAPEWLERTRYVCFGVLDNGLPDAGGWVGLIGSPLGMLFLLLVGWGRGVRNLVRRARTSPALAGTLTALGFGALMLVAGAFVRVAGARAAAAVTDPVTALAAADHPRLDTQAPPLDLIDHNGVIRSLASLRGRPVLVTFAFGHCQTVCPIVVRNVLAAQAVQEAATVSPAVLIVTVDPWRDMPSRLPSIAQAWRLPADNAWVLGGEIDAVESALDAWRVARERDLRTGDVTHPALVYVIDAAGRIAFATTGGADVLGELLRRL